LPNRIPAREFEAAAAAEGVSVRGGHSFLVAGGESSQIRLCFAAPALDQINAGAERLGAALRRLLQRSSNAEEGASTLAAV
jgi:DNA-binding transcriptional MocR family regulator